MLERLIFQPTLVKQKNGYPTSEELTIKIQEGLPEYGMQQLERGIISKVAIRCSIAIKTQYIF